MQRRFTITVAGESYVVGVQTAGETAFEVTVGQAPPVRVERRARGPGHSAWHWYEELQPVCARVSGTGADLQVGLRGLAVVAQVADGRKSLLASLGLGEARGSTGPLEIRTQMPGRVVKVLVSPGMVVSQGQPLVVVEAMKMENELKAPREARVTQVAVTEGAAVEAGARLLVLE